MGILLEIEAAVVVKAVTVEIKGILQAVEAAVAVKAVTVESSHGNTSSYNSRSHNSS